MDYARNLQMELDEAGVRAIIDERNEKTGRKIRDAEMKKIPYMLIVGEKEEAERTLSVRKHTEGDKGVMGISDFIALINDQIKEELSK